MKLRALADIYSGLSFREKIVHDPLGEVGVAQLRNLIHEYSAIDSDLDRIAETGIKPKFYLVPGDILIVSKGANNHAVRVDSPTEKVIASSSFFIIKLKGQKTESSYLYWFLNHPKTQNELKKQQSGTYTPSLKIDALQNLEIPLPNIKEQIRIGRIYQLQLREKQIQNQLIANRQTLIDNLLISTIQKIK